MSDHEPRCKGLHKQDMLGVVLGALKAASHDHPELAGLYTFSVAKRLNGQLWRVLNRKQLCQSCLDPSDKVTKAW